jgi:hypothetical protein
VRAWMAARWRPRAQAPPDRHRRAVVVRCCLPSGRCFRAAVCQTGGRCLGSDSACRRSGRSSSRCCGALSLLAWCMGWRHAGVYLQNLSFEVTEATLRWWAAEQGGCESEVRRAAA